MKRNKVIFLLIILSLFFLKPESVYGFELKMPGKILIQPTSTPTPTPTVSIRLIPPVFTSKFFGQNISLKDVLLLGLIALLLLIIILQNRWPKIKKWLHQKTE
jgi:hypothetical protein